MSSSLNNHSISSLTHLFQQPLTQTTSAPFLDAFMTSEPGFVVFSKYLSIGLSIYNFALPIVLGLVALIGVLVSGTDTVTTFVNSKVNTQWTDYKSNFDYITDKSHIWLITCNYSGDNQCYFNVAWISKVF